MINELLLGREAELIPKTQKNYIRRNRSVILENLNLDDPVVLTDLEAGDVINKNVREQILASIGDGTKNDRMVNYMLKQSQASMERFIEVLQKRNQAHVAALFDGHVNKGKSMQSSSTTKC